MKRSHIVPKISSCIPAVALFVIWTGAANAHTHIMIDAKATIVFDDSGAVSAVRHTWTFDAAFSAWSVQGIDTDRDGVPPGATGTHRRQHGRVWRSSNTTPTPSKETMR